MVKVIGSGTTDGSVTSKNIDERTPVLIGRTFRPAMVRVRVDGAT